MPSLATATATAIGPSTGVRIGVITTAVTGRLFIDLGGASIDNVGRLATYQPTKGDTVAVLRHESTWIILGRIVPGA